LSGQRWALREIGDRGSWGVNFVVAQPLGEFRRNANVAPGISAFAVIGGRGLGLRIDGGWMVYDAQYQGYGVSTSSQIGTLTLGPQLTVGSGPLRLYGFVAGGGSLFWSDASYDGCGCYDRGGYLDGHLTATMTAGSGLLITVARRRTPIAIDLGVRAVRHDRVRYVPAGGFTQTSYGTLQAHEVETPVDMRVFQIGVSIGIR
jgi:hypothetical protein